MSLFLDRIDAAPILYGDFDNQFLQWIWVLVDTLNENFGDIQNALNLITAQNVAIHTETVTLTNGSASFTVANGSLYNVGDAVIGNGVPMSANIASIAVNLVTLNKQATLSASVPLSFIPLQGSSVSNGVILYDTTNNVYVGMQNGVLVKFTTTSYP